MQKWEYCYLYGIRAENPLTTFTPRYAIFSTSEPHLIRTDLTIHRFFVGDEEVLGAAGAIAMLGEEGWELVSAVQSREYYTTLFFKRPKD